MGRLIAVLGNAASGKTTLVTALARELGLTSGLERVETRPFQELFMQKGARYAFANQVDFLLNRAEQEARIRAAAQDGIQDGGLEMDAHVFTELFYRRGYLTVEERAVCRRLYRFIRRSLPLPDLVIWLDAPAETCRQRFQGRARPIDIVQPEDIPRLQALLRERIAALQQAGVPIWRVDAARHDPGLERLRQALLPRLRRWQAAR